MSDFSLIFNKLLKQSVICLFCLFFICLLSPFIFFLSFCHLSYSFHTRYFSYAVFFFLSVFLSFCLRCSSVKVGGSAGCRHLRSFCSQADEPEGKPGALSQYDSLLIFLLRNKRLLGFGLVCIIKGLFDVTHLFSLCLTDNLMIPLTNYGIPW